MVKALRGCRVSRRRLIARFLGKFIRYRENGKIEFSFHFFSLFVPLLLFKIKNLPNFLLVERNGWNKQQKQVLSFPMKWLLGERLGGSCSTSRIIASSIEILAADLYYIFRDWVSNVWMKFEPWKYYKRNADKLPGNGRIY